MAIPGCLASTKKGESITLGGTAQKLAGVESGDSHACLVFSSNTSISRFNVFTLRTCDHTFLRHEIEFICKSGGFATLLYFYSDMTAVTERSKSACDF